MIQYNVNARLMMPKNIQSSNTINFIGGRKYHTKKFVGNKETTTQKFVTKDKLVESLK
jgi:hypothetical protein